MKARSTYQLTIRKVPERVRSKLKDLARRKGASLNKAALEVLERGLGLSAQPTVYDDLDALAGSWLDDPEFDRALESMRPIDAELWR